MKIAHEDELLDRKTRGRLLDRTLQELEYCRLSFPDRMFHVVGAGTFFGFVVKEDDQSVWLEYPILVALTEDAKKELCVNYSIVGFGIYWVKLNKAHVLYETVGPEELNPVYLRYLHGFRVSQLGSAGGE